MASLGNIGLSLLSGQQQTNLSAANFNFDFTLVKVAPPKEYEGLGQCLSVKRKTEAEEGLTHSCPQVGRIVRGRSSSSSKSNQRLRQNGISDIVEP